ncbi:hypothetical protein AB1Y20_006580 [Prymnesium parvum]|uniref:Uncharacterized protein n=1 Tax=Prymnesium parvum TaxID=97485 RepID=A0AB34IZ87_PRYPA
MLGVSWLPGILRACSGEGVRHEIFSAHEDPSTLAAQSMREIPKEVQQARERRVPFEPPQGVDDDYLQWEFRETNGFLHKELKKDPRLKPDDIEVSTDHMSTCTSCKNYEGLQQVLHPDGVVEFGTDRQLLVDDWPISSWANVVRFLNEPAERFPVLEAQDGNDARFGCPCSILPTQHPGVPLQPDGTPDGGVLLIHSSGIREGDNVNRYRARTSPNFVDNWSSGRWVEVEGIDSIGTFTAVTYPSLPAVINGKREQWKFLGGYEGYQGEACLAVSSDGLRWSNLHSKGDHPGGQSFDDDDDDWSKEHRCYGESDSFLKRAADAYVLPIVDKVREREIVWFRKDFGTNGGWREIRGVQAVSLDRAFAQMSEDRAPYSKTQIAQNWANWYFDRLGKVERYRRHIYTMTLTPYNDNLWIGLMTVIEWAKDASEAQGPNHPFLQRDTLNVYFVTSRDGIHIDDEWIYAHRPLLPKAGKLQSDWDAGLLFPSAQFLSTDEKHYMYFEARPGSVHHEQRFESIARLGIATWLRDRVVGLKRAHADAPSGVVTTKPFHLKAGSLWLLLDCASTCGKVVVQVLHQDGATWVGREEMDAIPLSKTNGWVEAVWATENGDSEPLAGRDASVVPLDSVIRLQITLMGDALLYAFELRPQSSSQASSPLAPPPPHHVRSSPEPASTPPPHAGQAPLPYSRLPFDDLRPSPVAPTRSFAPAQSTPADDSGKHVGSTSTSGRNDVDNALESPAGGEQLDDCTLLGMSCATLFLLGGLSLIALSIGIFLSDCIFVWQQHTIKSTLQAIGRKRPDNVPDTDLGEAAENEWIHGDGIALQELEPDSSSAQQTCNDDNNAGGSRKKPCHRNLHAPSDKRQRNIVRTEIKAKKDEQAHVRLLVA